MQNPIPHQLYSMGLLAASYGVESVQYHYPNLRSYLLYIHALLNLYYMRCTSVAMQSWGALLVRHLTQLTMHIQSVQPNRHSITDYKPACYRSLRAMGWLDLTVSPTLSVYITLSVTSSLLLYRLPVFG